MSNSNRKLCLVLAFMVLLIPLVQIPVAYSEEENVQQKALSMIWNVLELDNTKYTAELSNYFLNKPQEYGLSDAFGGLPDEMVEYKLRSTESNLSVFFRFVNKTMIYCNLSPLNNASVLYAKQTPANMIEETKNLVQKLQASSPSSRLQEARTILDAVNEVKPMNFTSGDMKLQISVDSSTEFSWWRTLNGVDYPVGLYIYFVDGTLRMFNDFSSFYKIGDSKVNVNHDEALRIAKENANRVNKMNATLEDGSTQELTLELREEPSLMQLKAEQRELFTWHPYWRIQFESDKPIGGTYGVEVGIWADTGEISICQLTTHHGVISDTSYLPGSSSEPSQSDSIQDATQDNNTDSNSPLNYVIAGAATVAIIVVASAVAVKRRRK